MGSISSPGLGSGLDVNNIVKSLVDAERVPFDEKKDAAQESNTAKISSFGNIKSSLTELDDILFDLKLPFTFNERIVDTTSSNFTVEAGSASLTGSYEIEVLQLAEAHKMTSEAFTEGSPVGEGTLAFTVGSDTFEVEVSATDDLDAVKAKISDASNGLVTASIITADGGQHLTLTGSKTGTGNDISITVTDIDGDITDGAGLSRLKCESNKSVCNKTNHKANQKLIDFCITKNVYIIILLSKFPNNILVQLGACILFPTLLFFDRNKK